MVSFFDIGSCIKMLVSLFFYTTRNVVSHPIRASDFIAQNTKDDSFVCRIPGAVGYEYPILGRFHFILWLTWCSFRSREEGSSGSGNKACREKMRRDRLNDRSVIRHYAPVDCCASRAWRIRVGCSVLHWWGFDPAYVPLVCYRVWRCGRLLQNFLTPH